jgi:hypothetical protein
MTARSVKIQFLQQENSAKRQLAGRMGRIKLSPRVSAPQRDPRTWHVGWAKNINELKGGQSRDK